MREARVPDQHLTLDKGYRHGCKPLCLVKIQVNFLKRLAWLGWGVGFKVAGKVVVAVGDTSETSFPV